MGEKNKVIKNSPATTRDVKPDLPQTTTQEVDFTYALDGVEPNVAPTVVATASAVSAALALGSFPSFIKLACSATPIIVPVVSKWSRVKMQIQPYTRNEKTHQQY